MRSRLHIALKKVNEISLKFLNSVALDIAANHKFDLVISDVGLPDGSGFDLMKSLHSMYGLRGIKKSRNKY